MNTCCSSYNDSINNRTKRAFLLVRKAIWVQRLATTDCKNAQMNRLFHTNFGDALVYMNVRLYQTSWQQLRC